MTKHEFIDKLKNALESDLNSSAVQEHVNYYNDYISNEIRNGRSESDVIAELGDPWAIAKNIITSAGINSNNHEEYSYTSAKEERNYGGYGNSYDKSSANPKVHVFGLDSWWKKLLVILGIIGVVMIVFSIITGLISLIAPFVLPIIFITLILRLFKNLKR